MSYIKTVWENKPSTKTPLSAENLNHMEDGIVEAHNELEKLPQWSKQDKKPQYTYDEVGADKQGTAKELVEQHNESEVAHEDIRATLSDLEIYKANSILQTVSGETIVTKDSAKVHPVNLKTYGKSTQKTYEGNQLYDVSDNDFISDTYINSAGNTLGTVSNLKNYSIVVSVVPNTTYIISGVTSNRLRACTTSEKLTEGATKSVSIVGIVKDGNESLTITSGENDTYLYVNLSDDETGFLNTLTTLMLNTGDTELPWEPYTGNQPSPNPDYPQEIASVGDEGSVTEKVLTSQLFDVNNRKTNFGNEITIGNDDWMSYEVDNTNGSDDKYINFFTNPNKFLIENKAYMAVVEVDTLTDSEIVSISPNSLVSEIPSQFQNYLTVATSGIHCKQAITKESFDNSGSSMSGYIIVSKGKKGIGKFRISLIEDLTVTADTFVYEPYSEQPLTLQTPNGLRGIPLGSTIPDAIKNSPIHMSGVYWDSEEQQYYISDTKNENGKDVQRIEKVDNPTFKLVEGYTADGSELFGFKTNNKDTYDDFDIISSTHLLFDPTVLNKNKTGAYAGYGAVFARIKDLSDVDEFNNRMSGSTFYYILENPIIIDTSEEDQAKYDSVHMNYPNTTIVNDAGAYMEVEYVCDTKKHIEQNYTSNKDHDELKQRVSELESIIVRS